ncbi:MAG: gliding motility lipoprotein GldH [Cyclobacteriaceae bacterium]|nr:gliding motility lipoprotein GldH [Cyclobacteriaceae bacterium]UYN87364.1 MAG: gliding motility lipoprotein GldH [Cyclobacteriaceae bacterium]
MRISYLFIALLIFCFACDRARVFEQNYDFKKRYWAVSDKPAFSFKITDADQPYNLYLTLRNESDYPNSNIYFTYILTDTAGTELEKKLASEFLFERKTGRPLGSSGLGYVFEHQFPLLMAYRFKHPGTYSLHYEQFMRTDTLRGVLSVGLRVERTNDK